MTRYQKLLLWVFFLIPLIGCLGFLRAPGEVNLPLPPSTTHCIRVAPGKGCAQTAPNVAASPSSQGTAAATVSSAPPSGRAAASAVDTSLSVSDLIDLISAKPTTVTSLTMTNGSNVVLVQRQGAIDSKITVSDGGGKHDLSELATANHIRVIVKEVKVDPIIQFISNNLFGILIFGGFLTLMLLGQRNQAKQMKVGVTRHGLVRRAKGCRQNEGQDQRSQVCRRSRLR